MNPKTIWSKEPAVIVGIVAAAILAVAQSLAGNGVISGDAVDIIGKAIDPSQGGWALPIIAGLVTRFAVYSPATVATVAAQAAATGDPTVTEGPP